MTRELLNEILEKYEKWLHREIGGERAFCSAIMDLDAKGAEG